MISYEDSQKILRDILISEERKTCIVSLDCAVGQVLSSNVYALEQNPRFDHSAMDGYAICLENLPQYRRDSGYVMPSFGCLLAGEDQETDLAGGYDCNALEIMTGASIPRKKYCAVLRQEDVKILERDRDKQLIYFETEPKPGQNIRRAGEDIQSGQLLLKKNTRLELHHLMVLASLGIHNVGVLEKIRISIASTGKELVDYKTEVMEPGRIRNATGIYIESYLRSQGYAVENRGIIQDESEVYKKQVEQAFDEGSDIFLSTGAVSIGKVDFVCEALREMGAKIHFHRCAIRPGKPILFASLMVEKRMRYIFGIPGNVAASSVGLRFFVLPFLRRLSGISEEEPMWAELVNEVKTHAMERSFCNAEVFWGEKNLMVSVLGKHSPASLSPFLKTNAWVSLPASGENIVKGEKVEVYCL